MQLSKQSEQESIGEICAYYGGLIVKKESGKCYWAIEDWDEDRWEEIPESLYNELVKFEAERVKK